MNISRFVNNLPKRLFASALLGLAVFLPVASSAASTVKIEGTMGVANVTKGDTNYKASTSASYDQVVKFEVYYHNRELPDSGKNAQNLRVKINIPSQAGKTQTQSATISADNSNTVTSKTTVNLNRSDAYLQYIPGSAVWKHNVGTNAKPKIVETKVSDAIVNTGTGLRLENEKPCYNFAATVTVLARVEVPGVSITKQVEKAGQTNKWSTKNTANPGDTLKYLISYKNTGNTVQKQVVLRDNLPPKMALVSGTTYLADASHPKGVKVSDLVTKGGINAGNFGAGATAYLTFEVKVPAASQLACGQTEFRNVGVAHPQGMSEYYNTAITDVTKKCAPKPGTPVYTCNLLSITKGDNRTVKAKVTYTAKNGASFKTVNFNWGDNQSFTTSKTTAQHSYAKAGTYTITAKVLFSVNGKDKFAPDNAACVKQVTFKAPKTPTPPTTPTTPTQLPNTGAGNTIGLFAGVVVAGTIGYRLFLSRKLGRH